MYEIYPGIKGNTHGDKKLIKPAPNAITSSIIYFFIIPLNLSECTLRLNNL